MHPNTWGRVWHHAVPPGASGGPNEALCMQNWVILDFFHKACLERTAFNMHAKYTMSFTISQHNIIA